MPSVPDIFDSEEYSMSLDYLYDSNEYYEESILDVWNNCVKLSAISIFHTLYKIILVNLVFSFLVSTGKLSETSTTGKILILTFFIHSYFLLHLGCFLENKYNPIQKSSASKVRYLSSSNVLKYILITSLVLCEYLLLEPETWLEARGVVMIFAMKLISLADDIDNGITSFPTASRYFGYIFCGANIMFGPWTSFQEYVVLYHRPTQKNVWWIYGIFRALFISIFFLMISNCWTNFFISENSNRWLVAYKEALSFRTSHYFICYLSEASMLAAGYKTTRFGMSKNSGDFSLLIH
ncbi:hypothetical protein NQ318_001760 [Aromia moschata]|uniref:Uncharacterized protein n=1 Tax=Aromia moschata TaxID=1265417 RepID=A0AAV8XSQ2_9CUCU|nr:hypothetical protein NQ318_001760 [Aromia moschata]